MAFNGGLYSKIHWNPPHRRIASLVEDRSVRQLPPCNCSAPFTAPPSKPRCRRNRAGAAVAAAAIRAIAAAAGQPAVRAKPLPASPSSVPQRSTTRTGVQAAAAPIPPLIIPQPRHLSVAAAAGRPPPAGVAEARQPSPVIPLTVAA
ncbi:hypothetical protein Scep_024745 [Stephania cephalantha]|uniref:Uncharacterized protein n=1 Tax=Stephania cephalantha TaxID=152367 RepID=A0AAP0EZW7_9MAGN